eukprot:2934212-Rhodomonas_salina.1
MTTSRQDTPQCFTQCTSGASHGSRTLSSAFDWSTVTAFTTTSRRGVYSAVSNEISMQFNSAYTLTELQLALY